MAKRRMFNIEIVGSDAFLDMPVSAQALYFQLGMRADDDGFIGNAKSIQRAIGASVDDLRLLVAKRFLLAFDNGVVVIKHWLINNQIRNDRYTATVYVDEKAKLLTKENRAYTENESAPTLVGCQMGDSGLPDGCQMVAKNGSFGCQMGDKMEPQYSIGKYSIDKTSKKNIYCVFFDSVWELYPSKKGKTAVTHKALKEMQEAGEDVVRAALQQYISTKPDWQHWMNGSTFFNGRWRDYVGEHSPWTEKRDKPGKPFDEFIPDGVAPGSEEEYMLVEGKRYNRWGQELNEAGYPIIDFGLSKFGNDF